MTKFRIMPHGRLQEWVAEEHGFYADEGLDYEFVQSARVGVMPAGASVIAADGAPTPILNGAFESMEAGRACDVSSACHWAVGMAATSEHGHMWGHAYSVTPAGIYVARDSEVRTPDDLRGIEVGVGYHSGSHFSGLQALSGYMAPEDIKVRFIGSPQDRVNHLVDGHVQAANLFGVQHDIVEQLGFRKVLDTSFMIGFLVGADADIEDCHKYFNALRRAQTAIDLEPERYKHYFGIDVPERYKPLVDLRGFSTGERLVFETYTREMYERTHRWMLDMHLFEDGAAPAEANYAGAVLV